MTRGISAVPGRKTDIDRMLRMEDRIWKSCSVALNAGTMVAELIGDKKLGNDVDRRKGGPFSTCWLVVGVLRLVGTIPLCLSCLASNQANSDETSGALGWSQRHIAHPVRIRWRCAHGSAGK